RIDRWRRGAAGGAGLDGGDDHLLLGGPAAVDRGLGALRTARDFLEGDGRIAALAQQLHHGGDDPRLGPLITRAPAWGHTRCPRGRGDGVLFRRALPLGVISKRHVPYRN